MCEAVIRELPDIPKVMPLLLEKTSVPVLTDCVPAEAATPPPPPVPPASADREIVRPLLALAVVPEILVSASVGLPWLCVLLAKVLALV